MKLLFCRRIILAFLLLLSFKSVKAQDETHTDFLTRANFIFANLEKNKVPNGLLLDYAMELADLRNYNGVLTDTTK